VLTLINFIEIVVLVSKKKTRSLKKNGQALVEFEIMHNVFLLPLCASQ